jgi:hypothetical protein
VQLLQDRDRRVFGAWVASPESLDLRQDGADALGRAARVGRTTLVLEELRAGAWRAHPGVVVAHDTDSSRVLVLLRPGLAWPDGPLRLTLTYRRNHGDDPGPGDHRYDRPVEKRGGSDAPEVASVALT